MACSGCDIVLGEIALERLHRPCVAEKHVMYREGRTLTQHVQGSDGVGLQRLDGVVHVVWG